jgi:hypothetical protein
VIKTDPTGTDDWCETTLTPVEGQWSLIFPLSDGATVQLGTLSKVGSHSVQIIGSAPTFYEEMRFSLNDGYEFDGSNSVPGKTAAQLHFWVDLESGKFDGTTFYVFLRDAAGYRAYINLNVPVDGTFHHYDLNLGPQGSWKILDSAFDWRYIKYIDVQCWTTSGPFGVSNYGSIYIDEMYFSWNEVVLGKLYVKSQPVGKAFTLDGTSGTTDSDSTQPYGLMPGQNYTLSIDPSAFLQWEDRTKNPNRTINLAQGQQLTVTAYYSGTPPPPPSMSILPYIVGGAILVMIILGAWKLKPR